MAEEKKKRTWIYCLIIIVIGVLIGASIILDKNTVKFDITDTNMYFDGSTTHVTGKCKNLTDEMTSITIEYAIYDSEGFNMGTAFAYVKNLGAGETAYFDAELLFCERIPHSYKFIQVKSYDYLN